VLGAGVDMMFLSLPLQISVLTSPFPTSARPWNRHDRVMNPSSNGTKRLYRLREGRVVSGVCVGLGAYFGVDPTLVRLIFALASVIGGLGVLLYLCAWVVIPEEGESASIAESLVNKRRS
jgi:phage shock protein C